MRIRPCIDIHNGRVKQIVGSSLKDADRSANENFISGQDADYYAAIYRDRNLPGGHIILLNPASDTEAYAADREQALKALHAYPEGMQIGGGITPQNAGGYLQEGASHVIVTSYIFHDGKADKEHLEAMERAAGREHLVLDLSCRRRPDGQYVVVTDRWQKMTDVVICRESLDYYSRFCDEFLIHAADVEGRRGGIERQLAGILGSWQQESGFPVTYAGGVHSLEDLAVLRELSGSLLDVTVGSALDLFGGSLSLDELVQAAEGQ